MFNFVFVLKKVLSDLKKIYELILFFEWVHHKWFKILLRCCRRKNWMHPYSHSIDRPDSQSFAVVYSSDSGQDKEHLKKRSP